MHALPLLLAATAFGAEVFTEVRFLPPDPDTSTPVTARVSGIWPTGAPPACAQVTLSDRETGISATGRTFSILPGCIAQNAPAVLTPWSLDVPLGVLEAGVYAVEVRFQTPFSHLQAESSLAVQEAQPAFSVTPDVMFPFVSPRVGELVVIRGKDIDCRDTTLCAAPVIRFGDRVAQIVRIDPGQINVRPPAGTGTVDVTVELGSLVLRRIAAFHYASEDRPALEFLIPILLPVLFSGSGVLGSEWDTEAAIRNDNDFALISPYGSPFDPYCILCSPAPPHDVDPHETRVVSAKSNSLVSPGGRLLYIARQAEPRVRFGLIARDLSRQAEALGTEVPVVREADLYDGSFSLLNVRLDPGYRAALRIYSIDKAGTARMTIRRMESTEVLVDTTVALIAVTGPGQHHANVTIGDLAAAYPHLPALGPVRIEIDPGRGDLRLWGFASITNNQTQHVTVISPQ